MNKNSNQSRYWVYFLAIIASLFFGPINSNAQVVSSPARFEGFVQFQEGVSFCMQGRFELRDCNNQRIIRVTESENGPDLDALIGQYVTITGDNVGVECPVIDADIVEPTNNPCNANVSYEGVLTEVTGPTACLQGEFFLRNCQGEFVVLLSENQNGPDLNSLLGQYVRVSGPNVGVECPVIAPTEVTSLANACNPTPNPQIGSPREGILQVDAQGNYQLLDCQSNIKMQLTIGPNSNVRLQNFVGQYVRIKGKMNRQGGTIKVRGITVKNNPCGN